MPGDQSMSNTMEGTSNYTLGSRNTECITQCNIRKNMGGETESLMQEATKRPAYS